ncbi:MAG: rhodanese-like domain-containing protein [Pseudomonadota bacterium]|nr:rhodanese-like domain-containing protein [Pseudomonadota bacterium]
MSRGYFTALYEAGAPFALIDTRERREHVDGHWFGSTNIPLSSLARTITRLVPDRGFHVHLLDWQDRASGAAATLLSQLGYQQLTVHQTSRPAAFGEGFVKGEYVWSKAFGEVVAHGVDFPEVTPDSYMRRHQGAPLFDVRPTAEYSQFTIPTSQSLPNSLLLANLTALRSTGKTALLHCAGRTRSIIGACTLKAAGYNGPFAVFRGGTQAWQLAGYDREHNADRRFATEDHGTDDVRSFLEKWRIDWREVTSGGLADFTAEHDGHLLFDVSDDSATGQAVANGITRISGTNLIQQTDQSIARYHVPVVLFDHGSASRAAFTAFWLTAMGFDVQIARLDSPVPPAPRPNLETRPEGTIPILSADQITERQQPQATLIDLRPSPVHAARHLAGSDWRNISIMLNGAPDDRPVTLICDRIEDGCHATKMLVSHGWQVEGIYPWRDGDLPPAQLASGATDSPIDQSALFAGRHHGNLQDARDYLAWEEALPAQIDPLLHRMWHDHLARALA